MCNTAVHPIQSPPLSMTPLIDALETLLKEDVEGFEDTLQRLRDGLSCNTKERYENIPEYIQTIRDILMACPSLASSKRISDGSFPLHLAAMIGDVRLGCVIASAYPAAALKQSVKGKTPLHVAAREGHADFVSMLLQLNPAAAQVATQKLKLPLHFAAGEGLTDICCQLLRAYPEGAALKSQKGKLPLHLASRRGFMETMQVLLPAYPQGLESRDWEKATPLHLAIRDGQENVAFHLIDICPLALTVRNINGELPLDIALRNFSSLALFSKLVKTWPEGGRCLLTKVGREEHVDSWEWSKIELCLQAVSGFFDKKDQAVMDDSQNHPIPKTKQYEYLPLHKILELSSNISLIQRVLATCTDLLDKKDGFGRLPLHIAAKHCNDGLGVLVEQILKLYPNGSFERDPLGRLPLHIALENKPDVSTLKLLLATNPKSAVQKLTTNSEETLTRTPPLFLAINHGCSMDIIYILSRCNPNLYSSDE